MKSPYTGHRERRSKQAEIFNWQICDDDNQWRASQPGTQIVSSTVTGLQHLQYWRRWWLLLVGLTLLTTAVVAIGWVQAQSGLAKIETEVQAAVDADLWATSHSTDFQQANSPSDVQVRPARPTGQLSEFAKTGEAINAMEIIELGDEWARVQVVIQDTGASSAYRQTLVYRQTDAGWQRIPATAPYWGRPQQFESRYFVFHYFAQDGDAVEAAAPKLDMLFPNFYAALLPVSPAAEKLHVQIDPEQTVVLNIQNGDPMSAIAQPLIVPSPSATLAPVEISEEELLLQAVTLALFNHLAIQASIVYGLPESWHPLSNAARLWLMWDQSLPLAIWREPLVQWVLGSTQGEGLSPRLSTPHFGYDLCVHHGLWMTMPTEIDIPVICVNDVGTRYGSGAVAFRYPYKSPPILSLSALMEQVLNPSYLYSIGQVGSLATTVVLATFFEYASSTYGYDKVPLTIIALSRYENLDTFIPAIYGVSLNELEVGWNNFLMEEYGVAP